MKRKLGIHVLRDALQVLRLPHEYTCAAGIEPVESKSGDHEGYRYWAIREARADTTILARLAALDDGLHERINKRAAITRIMAKYAHNGRVRIEESGRDCDMCEYTGKVHEIDATWVAYYKLECETHEWADGPFYFQVIPWELEVERTSRDLALEAFEDGHPHYIVSRFG